jgi:predicted nucleotidyltransferase
LLSHGDSTIKNFDVLIDLLPFGDIERNKQQGFNILYTDLHVFGFKEVMEDSSEYVIEDRSVKVPPLPGMVLLKLIAWSDRPEKRHDDLFDILYVIDHYHDLEFEKIITDHHELIPEEGEFDERVFSARVLGRRAKEYVDKSKDLRDRIFKILDENTFKEVESKIAKKWALKKGWDLEYCTLLL